MAFLFSIRHPNPSPPPAYADQLAEPEAEDTSAVGFTPLTLEAVVDALATAGATDIATQLRQRYVDFGRILDLALSEADGNIPTSPVPSVPSSQRPRPPKSTAETSETTPADRVAPSRRRCEHRPDQRTRRSISDAFASSEPTAPAADHRIA